MKQPTQSLTAVIRILHTMHSSTQLDTTYTSPLTTASPPTITALRFLARTLNIPIAHDTFTHPQPTTSHYHHAYAAAATIYPCPPQHRTLPHHPVLYQFYTQLAQNFPIPTRAPPRESIQCPTCTGTPPTHAPHTPCSSFIAFSLLSQNTYAIRWDAIVFQPTPLQTSPIRPILHTQPTPYTPASRDTTASHPH